MEFLHWLADIRTPFLTALFSLITILGEEVFVVAALCALYWCVNKELSYGVCISFFVSVLIVQSMKIAFRVDRPWILDPAFTPVASAIQTATGYSFPSGHTQSAASLFGYLGLASGKKKTAVMCWIVVALVALSRMYLGVHTPADVLVSMLICFLVSLGTLQYLRKERPDAPLFATLAGLSAAVLLYGVMLFNKGLIEQHYLSDCVKAASGCLGCAVGFFWVRRRIPFSTDGKPWQQAIKLLAGLLGLLFFKSGLKALLGGSLLVDAIRYFLLALWVLALYPWLLTRIMPRLYRA